MADIVTIEREIFDLKQTLVLKQKELKSLRKRKVILVDEELKARNEVLKSQADAQAVQYQSEKSSLGMNIQKALQEFMEGKFKAGELTFIHLEYIPVVYFLETYNETVDEEILKIDCDDKSLLARVWRTFLKPAFWSTLKGLNLAYNLEYLNASKELYDGRKWRGGWFKGVSLKK
jgi:hypothetical protein